MAIKGQGSFASRFPEISLDYLGFFSPSSTAFPVYFLIFANRPCTPWSRDKDCAFLGEALSQRLDATASFSAPKDFQLRK